MHNILNIINKLDGFGPVYVINLERRPDRREKLLKFFKDFNIIDYHFIDAIDSEKENLYENLHQDKLDKTKYAELACTLSHFKAIKFWLENSDSEYALIMEDDLSFETVEYWDFSWKDFIKSINFKYSIIQLQIGSIMKIDKSLHIRNHWDQCAGLYLIHRDHAKYFIKKHFINNKYDLPDFAVADYFLYDNDDTYAIPLFITNELAYKSDINPELAWFQTNARNRILEYWKNKAYLS
jgi:GR25 family glycosyltransferase involved in LPS biosynthesis